MRHDFRLGLEGRCRESVSERLIEERRLEREGLVYELLVKLLHGLLAHDQRDRLRSHLVFLLELLHNVLDSWIVSIRDKLQQGLRVEPVHLVESVVRVQLLHQLLSEVLLDPLLVPLLDELWSPRAPAHLVYFRYVELHVPVLGLVVVLAALDDRHVRGNVNAPCQRGRAHQDRYFP